MIQQTFLSSFHTWTPLFLTPLFLKTILYLFIFVLQNKKRIGTIEFLVRRARSINELSENIDEWTGDRTDECAIVFPWVSYRIECSVPWDESVHFTEYTMTSYTRKLWNDFTVFALRAGCEAIAWKSAANATPPFNHLTTWLSYSPVLFRKSGLIGIFRGVAETDAKQKKITHGIMVISHVDEICGLDQRFSTNGTRDARGC